VLKNNIFAFGGNAVIYVSRREEHSALIMEENVLISNGQPIYQNRSESYPNLGIHTSSNRIWDIAGTPVLFENKTSGKRFTLEEWQTAYGMDIDTKIEKPDDSLFDKIK
jgi:hypothetical protein